MPVETINLENFTDDDLNILFRKLLKETETRQARKREKLINNFKEALCALHDADITVTVAVDEYQEECDICLNNIMFY